MKNMFYDSRYGEITGCGIIACAALMIAALLAGCMYLASAECRYYEQMTGRETQWSVIGGCYIKTPMGFLPYDEYRARAITNEK